jgi:hypothetical protein
VVTPRDPSYIPYHVARSKNTADAYWRFIERHSQSPYADEAKTKLAKLLVQQRNKKELAKYVQNFPTHKHLVEDVLKEIETIEKINNHFRTNLEDGARVVVRPGEVIYSRGYFKAYVGRQEEEVEEEEGEKKEESSYETRLEKVIAPEFIKLELLTDRCFIMVEKFHALVNIYYKIKILANAQPGEYRVAAIIGAYQGLSADEEYRRGGKEISHIIEIVKHPLDSMEMLEVDFEAVKYFKQKQEKTQLAINNLKPPEGNAFGTKYMYKYNLTNYLIRLEEYKASQAEACYHLEQALSSPLPEIVTQAQAYMANLKAKQLFAEYKPIE